MGEGCFYDYKGNLIGGIMKGKNGVVLLGLKLEMRKVLIEADKVWKAHGQELTITSGLDGIHSPGSLHPYGYALDLRTRYFDKAEYTTIAAELRAALGDKYDVIVHYTHIHIEYDEILRR